MVINRDVIILIGYLSLFLLTRQLMEIRPSAISKAATFPQLATLSAVLLSLRRSEMMGAGTRSALFGVTGISGFPYVYMGLRWYQQKGGAPAEAPRLESKRILRASAAKLPRCDRVRLSGRHATRP